MEATIKSEACGRPLPAFRMHVWTIELTQALLGDPEPLMLPPIATIHLPSCGFHMTVLRKFGPPLQWPVVLVGPGFHSKYVAEPWYWFLAEGDFVHGNELLFYYRSGEDIWEMVLPPTALNFLFGSQKVIPIQRGYGKRNQWQIAMHDGVPSAGPTKSGNS
ncbi:hypothetical protein JHK84_049990 [Glycine max]|nr:hypothetical protein JHK84_049990 [Glycine max]